MGEDKSTDPPIYIVHKDHSYKMYDIATISTAYAGPRAIGNLLEHLRPRLDGMTSVHQMFNHIIDYYDAELMRAKNQTRHLKQEKS